MTNRQPALTPSRVHAARHGRSIEAGMREIPETAIKPWGRVKLDSLLSDIGRKVSLTEEEFALFDSMRDRNPARTASFE